MKANVAIQHSMLVMSLHLITTGAFYQDLGVDYYTRLRPNRAKAVRWLSSRTSFSAASTTPSVMIGRGPNIHY